MEHYKTSKLLNDSIVSKFKTRKRIEVNDLSGSQYSVNKNIRSKTPMLRSELCDYSDAYIVVKGKTGPFAPFIKCITKIDGTAIDDAEDLDLVMPMYNLLEYSSNYSYRQVVMVSF